MTHLTYGYYFSLDNLDTVQYWYSHLSLTNTSVSAVRTSDFTTGFPYSVYPCLRLFHETPHPECNTHPLAQYASAWPVADRAGKW
jgi:hypothetical protein